MRIVHLTAYLGFVSLVSLSSCSDVATYQQDKALLSSRTSIIELVGEDPQSRMLICPELQGRVMTTTFGGLQGRSNGWFNRAKLAEKAGPYVGLGGEDRVWIGPLGSQFSFYYQQLEPLDEDNWLVPKAMATDPYTIVETTPNSVSVRGDMELVNFKGHKFNLSVERKIKLLGKGAAEENLGCVLPDGVDFVAFRSENILTNTGETTWEEATGLATLLSMGMYAGTDSTTVIIPIPATAGLENIYQYFAPLDQDRLWIKDGLLYFRTDGRLRSKIGIPRELASPIYGSYSPEAQRLTIVRYRQTDDSLYFNSHATVQADPFRGEVIPVYNNGPLNDQVTDEASFYEMESAAALLKLAPGAKHLHYHEVYHFGGSREALSAIAQSVLGVSLVR